MLRLPHWALINKTPAVYDLESATAIEMVSKLYGAMQTLIDEYNKYTETLNKNIDTYETDLTKANDEFRRTMEMFVNNFIECVDTKIDKQNVAIATALDGIIETAKTITENAIKNGAILNDKTAREKINLLESELSVLENRMNTFSTLAEGSTTGDAELIDIRVKADGTIATSAGNAVREQFNTLKSNGDFNTYNLNKVYGELFARNILNVSYQKGRFETNGYDNGLQNFVNSTNLLTTGCYDIVVKNDALNGIYLYYVIKYISDTEGSIILSNRTESAMNLTISGNAKIGVRKVDGSEITNEDINFIKENMIVLLHTANKTLEEKIANLKKEGKVLRMGATIKDGDVSVGMMEVTQDDPLYSIRGGENAFVFYTERYQPIPLTVRGYGAGAGVTAAGVFGDILRTVSFNPDSN